jgi:site-specific DNA-cytosine methylase
LQFTQSTISPPPQELLVLDIFAGAGGLSFLEQRRGAPATRAALERRGVPASASAALGIRSRWAVDLNASAIATYRANHGDSVDVRAAGLRCGYARGVVLCRVVLCGVGWGVVRCGVVWCGVVWCGVC